LDLLPPKRRNGLEAIQRKIKTRVEVKIPDAGATELRASLGVDERFVVVGATRGSTEADEKRAAAVF